MNDLEGIPSKLQDQLAFTCTHEKDRIPPRHPEADQLYVHARWLVKGNILKQEPAANSTALIVHNDLNAPLDGDRPRIAQTHRPSNTSAPIG